MISERRHELGDEINLRRQRDGKNQTADLVGPTVLSLWSSESPLWTKRGTGKKMGLHSTAQEERKLKRRERGGGDPLEVGVNQLYKHRVVEMHWLLQRQVRVSCMSGGGPLSIWPALRGTSVLLQTSEGGLELCPKDTEENEATKPGNAYDRQSDKTEAQKLAR